MSETLVVAAPEPGGWLAEHQRTHCAGATALTTYQGLLFDEIVLPQAAAEAKEPLPIVLACNAFVDAVQNHAYLIPGEFAPEALWSFYVNDYVTQSKAGGPARYYANRGGDALAIKCTAAGLKSMVADPQLDLFNFMVRLKRSTPSAARKLAVQRGYRNVSAALHSIDKRFAELDEKEPLAARQKTWLKSFRKLKLVPEDELREHLSRMASGNPLFHQRRAEAELIRAEHERTDPAFQTVRTLCEQAGLAFRGMRPGTFAPMRAIWPEGPEANAFAFRVHTDRGAKAALFYVEGGLIKRRLAVLVEQGSALPLGSLTLTAAEYGTIVPR